jgi:hypothetical protein
LIDESYVYKRELATDLSDIEHQKLRSENEADNQQAYVKFERFVFWVAFSIRKLIESKKLSDEVESTAFKLISYPRLENDYPQDFMNWEKIDRHYCFDSPEDRMMPLRKVCDQLSHSFVFMPEVDEDSGDVAGLIFNSDRSRHEALFRMSWDEFRRLIRLVVEDDVVSMSYDRRTGVLRKSRVLPPSP